MRGVHSVLREIVCVRMRIFVCADMIWSVAWCHSVLREIVCVRMRIFVCADPVRGVYKPFYMRLCD